MQVWHNQSQTLNCSGTRESAYLAVKLLDRDRQWEGEEDGHTWIRHHDKLFPDSNKQAVTTQTDAFLLARFQSSTYSCFFPSTSDGLLIWLV